MYASEGATCSAASFINLALIQSKPVALVADNEHSSLYTKLVDIDLNTYLVVHVFDDTQLCCITKVIY